MKKVNLCHGTFRKNQEEHILFILMIWNNEKNLKNYDHLNGKEKVKKYMYHVSIVYPWLWLCLHSKNRHGIFYVVHVDDW